MYSVRFLDEAVKDLKKLDKAIAARIVRKLKYLAEHADVVEPSGFEENCRVWPNSEKVIIV